MRECRHPAAKQCIAFLIRRRWKFDRIQWNSYECSCILHFTEYLWWQWYFRPCFVALPQQFPCRIRYVDLFCVFISSLAASPSFKSHVCVNTDWGGCNVVCADICGITRMRGQDWSFIWKMFKHCKAYHSKVHAWRTKEEMQEPETVAGLYSMFKARFGSSLPHLSPVCARVHVCGAYLSPCFPSGIFLTFKIQNYVSNLRELIK